MHIPSSMLQGAICPITAGVSIAAVSGAGYVVWQQYNKSGLVSFGAVTALVFAMHMLNFPVSQGTSGHFLGGVLAASLLGTPLAILSMTIVLTVQAVVFADGGITTLGANVLNMALIGAGLGGVLLSYFKLKGFNRLAALAIASLCAVMLGVGAACLELSAFNPQHLGQICSAMLGVHLLIGLAEAGLTVGLVSLFEQGGLKRYANIGYALAAGAVFLSPMSSPLPDAMQRLGGQLQFSQSLNSITAGLCAGYQLPFFENGMVSMLMAAALGVVLVSCAAFFLAKVFYIGKEAV